MRLHHIVLLILSALLTIPASPADAQDRLYSISVSGSYTTSSQLFYDPDNPDDFLRSLNYPIDNIFGVGVDFRRSFDDLGLQFGLSAERLSKRQTLEAPQPGSQTTSLVHDGFVAIPVELTGYFRIPFSSDTWVMRMGGGGGLYFGSRYYEQAGATAEVAGRSTGVGIHVVSELQYNFQSSMGMRLGVKFRNVQFQSTNAFRSGFGTANGTLVPLDQRPFNALINIDGMMLSLGLVYRF